MVLHTKYNNSILTGATEFELSHSILQRMDRCCWAHLSDDSDTRGTFQLLGIAIINFISLSWMEIIIFIS